MKAAVINLSWVMLMFSKILIAALCLLPSIITHANDLTHTRIVHASTSTIFNGTIEGQQSINLRAMQAGRITTLSLLNGSLVSQGDIIAEVYSPELADNWHQAKANYKQKQANLERAKKEWHRAKALHKQQLLAITNVDLAQTNYLAEKANLAVAKAQENSSHKRFEERLIRAPFSGLVSQLYVRKGDYLNAGQPVVLLNEIQRQKAKFFVTQRHVVNLSLGQSLTLTIPVLAHKQQVLITELSRPKQGGNGLFEVTVSLGETHNKYIGLQAELTIESKEKLFSVKQAQLNYDNAGAAYILDDSHQRKIGVIVQAIKENHLLLRAASEHVDLATCCFNTLITTNNHDAIASLDLKTPKGSY